MGSRIWGLLKEKTPPQGGGSTQGVLFGQDLGGLGSPPQQETSEAWMGRGHHPVGEEDQETPGGWGTQGSLVCLGNVCEP